MGSTRQRTRVRRLRPKRDLLTSNRKPAINHSSETRLKGTRYSTMGKTLETFVSDLTIRKKLNKIAKVRRSKYLRKILEFRTGNFEELVFNRHQVTFVPDTEEVLLEYYVVDKEYPSEVLTFDQFSEIIEKLQKN